MISGLTITYGKREVVKGLELRVEQGEFVSLLGPSGSGKTSVLRSIGGYQPIAGGSIRIGGSDVSAWPPQRRDIGMVFQDLVLFPHLSVLRNVTFGLRTRKVPARERQQRAMEMLEMVQIADLKDRLPSQLSGGQRQRVALARALVIRPSLLLMDEPLGALDTKLRRQMQIEIRELQRDLGTTTIFVTHDQEEAMTMSDRVVVMRDGLIMDDGSPERIYRRPRNRFTAEFLGAATLLPVDVVEVTESGTVVRLQGTDLTFPVVDRPGVSGSGFILMRPESVLCSAEPGHGAIPGTVSSRTFRGSNTVLEIDVAGHRVSALQSQKSDVERGDPVHVSWDPGDLQLFMNDDSGPLPGETAEVADPHA